MPQPTLEKPDTHDPAEIAGVLSGEPGPECGELKAENWREEILVEAERIAHLGSYEWDVLSDRVYRSEELCRIFGVPLAEFKPSFEGYLERVHPEDRERTRAIIENAFHLRIPFEFDERIVHPDGTIHDVHSQGKWLFDRCQNPVKLIGICKDVTEQKFAEGLLSAVKHVLEYIAKRVPLPEVLEEICRRIEALCPPLMATIMLMEPEGKYIRLAASPSLPKPWKSAIMRTEIGPVGACGMTAFKKEAVVAEDISQDSLWTGYPQVLQIALDCGIRSCFSTPILSADNELLGTFALYYTEPRKPSAHDSELIKEATHLASVAIEHDHAAAVLQRSHDELERRVQDRTAELTLANERLKELDRLKSLFLASMSHELRTPLNSIIGFSGILHQGLAGPVNEEQKKQLGIVRTASRHLLTLINDLLDVSRIEAGKMDLELTSFDFVPAVNETIESMRPMAEQKHLRFTVRVSPPSIQMFGDRKRMIQVLLNLVNNAIKFTDMGSVEVVVSVENGSVSVCVADTGIGIKPEQMNLLFEAFRQLDTTAKQVYEGTGLGLHLCRKLVTLMHGEIGVESHFGKGSRFTFKVPLRQPAAQGRPS